MKGVDSRGPDLFSNASLLSMLSRSGTSSSVRSSSKGACSTSQDKSSRKRSDKEAPSSSSAAKRPLSSPSSSRYKVKETPERISNGPNIYQIGAEIGRGAFAVVYQAFNVETGDFVAVKRFPLAAIDDESLSSIQSEIELMQRLNHPNIVKYIDTIRTERYLYIVIEYIENGSLSTVLKKFGSFSEPLVAIYVTQILRGLEYLHEQGALHRDIKGANILTTKDGLVKLADFGVAIKLTDASNMKKRGVQEDSHDVVGSPYWIAPEIIEMATPTAACDIWSVGCTIIELLTGKPPYYNRAPMAALFSIVQDPHPPLPDGISTPIKDFLLLCFQKEPAMRSTAAVLLSHPWLQQAMLVAPRKPENSPAAFYFASTSNSPALSSQDSSPARSRIHTNSRPTPSASPPVALEDRKLDLEMMKASRSPRIQSSLIHPKSANIRSDDNHNPNLLVTIRSPKHSNSSAQCESESKGEAVMLVVKPTAAAGVGKSLIGLFDSGVDACPAPREVAMQRNSINMNDKVAVNRMMSFELPEEKDSWSNGDTGFTDLEHVTMLSSVKQMSSVTVSCSSLLEGGPTSTSLSSATGSAHEDDEDETEYTKVRVSRQIPLFCRSNSQRSQNALSENGRDEDSMNDMRLSIDDEVDERRGLYILRKALQSGNFLDHEEGHGEEGEGDGEGVSDAMRPPKKRLSLLLADNDDELDDSSNSLDQELNSRLRHMDVKSVASFDGFDDITTVLDIEDDEFDQTDSNDIHMNRSREIVHIMSKISSNCEKRETTNCCSKLLDIFSIHPDIKDHLVTHFGVTPILEMFDATQTCHQAIEMPHTRSSSLTSESSCSMNVVSNTSEFTADVLKVVNKIMEGSVRCQEELTMMGILPGILSLLYEASRAIEGAKTREKFLATVKEKPSSYTAMAFSSFLPHSMQPLNASPSLNYRKALIEINSSAMEAARFIHLISSSSSLTLQILIGAGGLNAMVHMISFSSLMMCDTDKAPKKIISTKMQGEVSSPESPKREEPSVLRISTSTTANPPPPAIPDDAQLMVFMGVDCVTEILLEQSSRAKDFCRMFVKIGLLRHISRAFECIHSSVKASTPCRSPSCHSFLRKRWGGSSRCPSLSCATATAKGHERKPSDMSECQSVGLLSSECNLECGYLHSIANIFLKFSRSDATVALHMAGNPQVIHTIMTTLRDPRLSNPQWCVAGKASASSTETKTSRESSSTSGTVKSGDRKKSADLFASGFSPCSAEVIETLLKCLKNLSMESAALADLERAGTISILIPLLDGPLSDRCKNHIVPCIFNLCRINKRRQEEAAVHGIIPHLQSFIINDTHLKQFALPILCSLAYTSPLTRMELFKHGGAAFYINLLKEAYWQTFALNSLAVWLANDTDYIENLLVEPTHLTRLVEFFRAASPQIIRVLHKPFLDMMAKSSVLSKALSSSGLYVTSLVKRLSTSDAIVLRSLLKMVQLLHQHHPNPRQFVLDNDLYNVAKGFAQSEGQVLVHQIANRLLTDFQNSTLT